VALDTAPDLLGSVLNADPLRSGKPALGTARLVQCRGGCAGNAVSGSPNAKTFTRPQAEIYYAKQASNKTELDALACKKTEECRL